MLYYHMYNSYKARFSLIKRKEFNPKTLKVFIRKGVPGYERKRRLSSAGGSALNDNRPRCLLKTVHGW